MKPGHKVSVVIGDFKVEHLTVNKRLTYDETYLGSLVAAVAMAFGSAAPRGHAGPALQHAAESSAAIRETFQSSCSSRSRSTSRRCARRRPARAGAYPDDTKKSKKERAS